MADEKKVEEPVNILGSTFEAFRRADWLEFDTKKYAGCKYILLGLLSRCANFTDDSENAEENQDRMVEEELQCLELADVHFPDLGALTKEDLKLLNIDEDNNRLVRSFKKNINQYISYDVIKNIPEAATYNAKILKMSKNCLMNLQANVLQMQMLLNNRIIPDRVEGDRYASRLSTETLNEMEKLVEEIEVKLNDVMLQNKCEYKKVKKSKRTVWKIIVFATSSILGVYFIKKFHS